MQEYLVAIPTLEEYEIGGATVRCARAHSLWFVKTNYTKEWLENLCKALASPQKTHAAAKEFLAMCGYTNVGRQQIMVLFEAFKNAWWDNTYTLDVVELKNESGGMHFKSSITAFM